MVSKPGYIARPNLLNATVNEFKVDFGGNVSSTLSNGVAKGSNITITRNKESKSPAKIGCWRLSASPRISYRSAKKYACKQKDNDQNKGNIYHV